MPMPYQRAPVPFLFLPYRTMARSGGHKQHVCRGAVARLQCHMHIAFLPHARQEPVIGTGSTGPLSQFTHADVSRRRICSPLCASSPIPSIAGSVPALLCSPPMPSISARLCGMQCSTAWSHTPSRGQIRYRQLLFRCG